MEYIVGVALALGAGLFTTVAGLDRDRALYPAILIVVASYYDLFAAMGDSAALVREISVTAAFLIVAIVGFRTTLWLVVIALAGHGVLDLFHGQLVANAGVPTWWPMFCLSYDVAAAAYLAWRLLSKKVDASNPSSFGNRIRPYVENELVAAKVAERGGDPRAGFRHLERAHVLSQRSTVQHVRVHLRMLIWALRHHDMHEVVGQSLRVIGAATQTWVGLVPDGNTGGANVSAFNSMTVSDDLAVLIETARSPVSSSN
jgi:hypothetical protein